jgi:hypothetical protein
MEPIRFKTKLGLPLDLISDNAVEQVLFRNELCDDHVNYQA